MEIKKAGFGGGCHWCTEAIFASLKGVLAVSQGWIASKGENENDSFSEGVLVTFDSSQISFDVLIAVHLHTHASTAEHSMRAKYRSAVYVFTDNDFACATQIIHMVQSEFEKPIITQVLRYHDFRINTQESLDYYFNNPSKPFCELYIAPKLRLLRQRFSNAADQDKLSHLDSPN